MIRTYTVSRLPGKYDAAPVPVLKDWQARLMTLDQAEAYADTMRRAGFDVVAHNPLVE